MDLLEFKNGDKMPALGLGTWKSKPGEVYNAVKEAIKIGYRHIDCAPLYMNEKEIGQALTDIFNEGSIKREELWITSKLWNNSHKRDRVKPALEKTLDDLQLDYLDLFLIHWPIVMKDDVMMLRSVEDFIPLEEVPISETWHGMEECADSGLARHIGVSNFSVKKLEMFKESCRILPEANQVESHPLLQQDKLLEWCNQNQLIFTAYSPLGSKDRNIKEEEPDLFELEEIKAIASDHNCSPAQILIKWAIQRGGSVVPKSVNPERLKQNFDAQSIELTSNEMERIAALDRHYRFINGRFWTEEGSPYTLENLWDE